MSYVSDTYRVFYQEKEIGCYNVFSDHTVSYSPAWGCPRDMEDELKKLGLDHEIRDRKPIKCFKSLIKEENRVDPGLSSAMGDYMFLACFSSVEEVNDFVIKLSEEY